MFTATILRNKDRKNNSAAKTDVIRYIPTNGLSSILIEIYCVVSRIGTYISS